MKTVYLIRHSEPFKCTNEYNEDSLQVQNEKYCLSIEGEQLAKDKFSSSEFDNIDTVYSSNYVRAIGTAKYIANKNNLDVIVNSNFGERKMGISSYDELPSDYGAHQFYDYEYKIGDGECLREVKNRMYSAFMEVLNNNTGRIAIVSHGTAIKTLLREWCDIELNDESFIYKYNGNILLDRNLGYCETFKMTFDDNNLIDISVL